ncbi:hypothetical protein DL89DRAFT_64795 [Linderina pennispora]|uniref:SYO1-like TPR repeats domain-containing protein n=1 Tax=Linderina pennispora TaxID=61395 RepID=A0A1Y1VZ83_9FUNG|nr:uncharacterized protein DL89DRAFT_64795 [Linderina pennispora]ORX66552.1 hypothetical protein DL89DRAFT_64795 [Linderina pennispora]
MALRCSVLESAVGSMWTLTRGVEGCVPVTGPHIEGLVQICEFAPTSDLRVRAVGALGNIARRQPGFVDLNRRIGAYLLENVIVKPLLQPTKDPAAIAEPIVEALDLFFDIYSDMAYDYDEPVFVKGEFLARLRQVYLPAKKFAKTIDRRKHRELRSRAGPGCPESPGIPRLQGN